MIRLMFVGADSARVIPSVATPEIRAVQKAGRSDEGILNSRSLHQLPGQALGFVQLSVSPPSLPLFILQHANFSLRFLGCCATSLYLCIASLSIHFPSHSPVFQSYPLRISKPCSPSHLAPFCLCWFSQRPLFPLSARFPKVRYTLCLSFVHSLTDALQSTPMSLF